MYNDAEFNIITSVHFICTVPVHNKSNLIQYKKIQLFHHNTEKDKTKKKRHRQGIQQTASSLFTLTILDKHPVTVERKNYN